MAQAHNPTSSLGPNAWLVDEKYEQFRADPSSVSESWREFFADYRRESDAAPAATTTATTAKAPASPAPPAPSTPAATSGAEATPSEPEGEPLRGAAARVVANMEASLAVPTATSFRQVPAKLLEVNRKVINGYLGRTRGGR